MNPGQVQFSYTIILAYCLTNMDFYSHNKPIQKYGGNIVTSQQVGVHQGSALSSLLFVLCIKYVKRDLQKRPLWNLLYADNIVPDSNTKEENCKNSDT